MRSSWPLLALLALAVPMACRAGSVSTESYDVVIVGGTPGGITAAIAAARNGHTAVILERTSHVGGLPANGLGATDIYTRGATGGLFMDFIRRIRKHYVATYGEDSQQVKDCSDGYRFEPHVAEKIFPEMIAEHKDKITVRTRRQFDADPQNVVKEHGALTEITVTNRDSGIPECYRAKVFIDATYEGDLAAAAGADFFVGRESASLYNEPMAGKLYKQWTGPIGPGSTGMGDNAVQAYNYRLCLTNDPANRVLPKRPKTYNREDYASLVEDIRLNRLAAPPENKRPEIAWNGIGRITNMVRLPNGKTDANNHHAVFISTDLPEENWPWPTASWEWRDRFAQRLRDYITGLVWFVQNDPALPEDFRQRCREWGFAKDEYKDNDYFPRQVYVREGRRVAGEFLFTAHDARPLTEGSRPPVYVDSITASHYALDSHAVLKREPGRVHLDGFFSLHSAPYTVPYGVIVPKKVDNLLTPVPVSGTHIGFSTLRMEPCWMALGEAAGTAASISIEDGVTVRKVSVRKVQQDLLKNGAVLMHFRDASPGQPHYEALQFLALRGFRSDPPWEAKLNDKADEDIAKRWIELAGVPGPAGYKPGVTTRGELLESLYREIIKLPPDAIERIERRW